MKGETTSIKKRVEKNDVIKSSVNTNNHRIAIARAWKYSKTTQKNWREKKKKNLYPLTRATHIFLFIINYQRPVAKVFFFFFFTLRVGGGIPLEGSEGALCIVEKNNR